VGTDGTLGEVAADHTPEALAQAVGRVLDRRAAFDPSAMHAVIEARYAPTVVTASIVAAYRELGAGTRDLASPFAIDATVDADLLDDRIVVVAMRRNVAARRVGALPPELARGMVAVTSAAQGPNDVPLPPGPRWVEIDSERGFRDARARLGGAFSEGSLPVRVGRVIRHPMRTMRRRSLYQRRAEFRERTIATGIRDAIAAAGLGAGVTLFPLDLADLVAVLPLLGERPPTRLASTTLRGLAQAWVAAGGPALAEPAPIGPGAAYDPAAYWGGLHARHDLSAVGQSGLPPEINAWLYRSLARTLRGFLHRHGIDRPPPAAAFDVGVGTGYWVRFWRSLGVPTVDGCDLIPEAVDAVRAEVEAAGLNGTYTTADIGVAGSLPARTYGAVSCMNVLLHLTDDAAFDRALTGIATLVAPGGVLVLAEPMLGDATWERPYDPSMQSRARPVTRYCAPLEAAGLLLEDIRAGTVLANNPIEAGSKAAYRRYARWWRWVSNDSKANPRSARWLGPLVMGLDHAALRTGATPSTKLVLFRRPVDETRP
jgi:SAM-dependent methyltransferase